MAHQTAEYPGPSRAGTLFDQALALHQAGDTSEALVLYSKVIARQPDDADALNNIAIILTEADEIQGAIAACNRAIAARPKFLEAYNTLGLAHRKAGDMVAALDAFQKAIELNPHAPEVLGNVGEVLKSLGRFDEAKALLLRALKLRPDVAATSLSLADMVEREEAGDLLAHLTAVHANAKGQDRMLAAYGLASLFIKARLVKEAVTHLNEAGRIGKTLSGYRQEDDARLFDLLSELFAPVPRPLADPPAPVTPIFIVGMPRAGTTLVERVLARHPKVRSGGERTLLTRLIARSGGPAAAAAPKSLATLRRDYLNETIPLARDMVTCVTDKMPLNFRWIGHIRAALPEARIIHVTRAPEAICWSIFRTYFPAPGMAFSFDQVDIAKYHGLYLGLMETWRARYPGAIRDLSYEALANDPHTGTQALADAAGLSWHPDMRHPEKANAAVTTASVLQARQPIYAGSSRDWRHFKPGLTPMLRTLANQTGPLL